MKFLGFSSLEFEIRVCSRNNCVCFNEGKSIQVVWKSCNENNENRRKFKKKPYRSFFQRMFLIHDIKLASLKRLKEKLFVKEDLTNSEYEITRILYFIRLKKNQDLSSPRS